MAASSVITLGIGTPSSITTFILVGLDVPSAPSFTSSISLTGKKQTSLSLSGSSSAAVSLTGRKQTGISLQGERA